jgi:flavin reductase
MNRDPLDVQADLPLPQPGEAGAMFKLGMRRLAGGVAAIAMTGSDGRRLGAAATAVCSLSAEPPALVVCLNLEGSIGRVLRPGRAFSVNLLGERHAELARVFGGMTGAASHARFEHGEWRASDGNLPVLADALVSFECVVADESIFFATHLVAIGVVTRVTLGSAGAALCYREGAFQSVA